MKKVISFNQAAIICLYLLSLLVLFHFAVIMGILVFEYAPVAFLWGGQMQTSEQLLYFEGASLVISALIFLVVAVRTQRLYVPKLARIARMATWLLFLLFLLNTLGNLLAQTSFERYFALVTGLLAFLLLRIAREKLPS